MKTRRSRGFTLIELMIVIAVVAILATITVISYNGVQQRARDSERKSDVTQLKVALDKYYAANSQYPAVCPGGEGQGCPVSYLQEPLAPYLATIPTDPGGTTNEYTYVRGGTSGNAYAIRVKYEATPVCKTGQNVNAGWWGSAIPICS